MEPKKPVILYLPIGVGTYHMETAGAVFADSTALLHSIDAGIRCPEAPLLSVDAVTAFLASEGEDADLILLQNLTFANAAYTQAVLAACPDVPVVLWTPREPKADGGRLKQNGLTGAFAVGHTLYMQSVRLVDYVFGLPQEPAVRRKLEAAVAAAALKCSLRGMVLGLVGEPPEGFSFGKGQEDTLGAAFGVRFANVPAETLMDRAAAISKEREEEVLAAARSTLRGLDAMPEENVRGFARLLCVYQDWIREEGAVALASRCWPDFFTRYGTPVCTVLSWLNAEGVMASCEGDRIGALSMVLAHQLSGQSCFFGDPVAMDPENGTLTFWHCGMAACDLARPEEGAQVGVHPNRKIGPTMEFGCRPAPEAVVLRIGETPEGTFRLFVARGEICDLPRQYFGTSIVVKTRRDAAQLADRAVWDGWEPHYVIAYGDIADALILWARMTGIEVWDYDAL